MGIDVFNKEQFCEVLEGIKSGWDESFVDGQYQYRYQFGKNGIIIVNSSIDFSNRARSCGNDSIRVWVEYKEKPLKKSQRWITRMSGWERRLREQILKACRVINDCGYAPKCPKCGGDMVLRHGVHGKFYGCLRFPACRGTRDYVELSPEIERILTG
jgi:hypothetical protein